MVRSEYPCFIVGYICKVWLFFYSKRWYFESVYLRLGHPPRRYVYFLIRIHFVYLPIKYFITSIQYCHVTICLLPTLFTLCYFSLTRFYLGAAILAAFRSAFSIMHIAGEGIADSTEVLRTHGNMSSATIFFVLKRVLRDTARDEIFAAGFGPGLSIEYGRLYKISIDEVKNTHAEPVRLHAGSVN